LRHADRSRGVEALADEIFDGLRQNTLRQTELVEKAMGHQALALLATLNAACDGADDLEQASAEEFRKHPDYATITSFPGLGELTGARVLAEIGDARNRFAAARALKAYAGSAPVTRASGRTTSITHRKIKNDRLAAAGWVWSFGAAVNQGPARELYRRRREHGDRHTAALRHLFNKMLGQLHHCLLTGQLFDPAKAFGTTSSPLEQAAAGLLDSSEVLA
jgi:transposase